MTKQEALDALHAVLVDGITADDISFTEEEHTQAVLAWNYFRKEGTNERNRWVAAVEEMKTIKITPNAWDTTNERQGGWDAALQELTDRMEATQ